MTATLPTQVVVIQLDGTYKVYRNAPTTGAMPGPSSILDSNELSVAPKISTIEK